MSGWGEFPGYPPGTQKMIITPEGTGSSGIMLIGEAPGEHEEKEGLPFRPHAEAGSVLERALWRAGIERSTLTIANMVGYRPPKNWLEGSPWEREALAQSWSYLNDLIQSASPKVIVALGGVAMRELTGLSGEKQGIGMTRGFLADGVGLAAGIPVIGSYHPSFLRRGSKERSAEGSQGKVIAAGGGTQGGMALLGVMIRDLQLARTVAQKGRPRFEYDDYKLGGTLEEWSQARVYLANNPDQLISYDFETQDSLQEETEEETDRTKMVREVTQVQISWRPGQALVSAWTPELRPILQAILELPNPKLDWNGRKFDRPILRDMQIRTDQGVWHDGMDLFHHSQPDLPRGLQFATSFFCPEVGPWKHFSHSQPFLYGAFDVDMPQRIWVGLKTGLSLTRDLHSGETLWGDGRYSGYTGQVARLAPVLDGMTLRGIPVDEDRRSALDKEFTQTLLDQFAAMQTMVPDEVKGLHSYAKTPKDSTETCPDCEGQKTLAGKNGKPKKCGRCAGRGEVLVAPVLGGLTSIKIGSGEKARTVETIWTQTEEEVQVKCPEKCYWSKPGKQDMRNMDFVTGDNESEVTFPQCPTCENSGKVLTRTLLWAKVEPFMPGSPQQVMGYLKRKMDQDIRDRIEKLKLKPGFQSHWMTLEEADKHAAIQAAQQSPWYVPTDYKSGKDTTGEAELRRLAAKTGDLLLPLVLDFREIQKLRGTYVEGWRPGTDGQVHPSFGFKPATGQLSCVAGWTGVRTPFDSLMGRVMQIKDLRVGDLVFTHKRRWQPITALWNKGLGEMFAVKFSDGQVLTCTGDHRLLLSDNEHFQGMDEQSGEYSTSSGFISVAGVPNGRRDGPTIRDTSAQYRSDRQNEIIPTRIQGFKSDSILTLENRGEESTNRQKTPQLDRGSGRWVRVFDLYEGWKAAVCSSDSDGGSLGAEGTPGDLRSPSHRHESEEQRSGQPSSGYAAWARRNSLPTGERHGCVSITEIHPVGSYEVYDISVEEDESYEAAGVFSHNSENPNAQNFPARGNLAASMKAMISAPPGRVFVNFDYKSFHVLTLGFEAQDPLYMRLARNDMHSFFALCGLLKAEEPERLLELPDQELNAKLKWYRKSPKPWGTYGGWTFAQIRDEKAKRAILGVGFGQKGRSLYMLNPESYASIREAEEVLGMLDRLFPRPAQWRGEVQMLADKQHCLVSRHGFVRRFWDVLQRKPVQVDYQPRGSDKVYEGRDGRRWLLKPGDDAEACIAFLPANDAFGTIRQVMVRTEERGLNERFWLANTVHDSLVMCPEKKDLEECLWVVREEMERPNPYLVDPKVAPLGLSCSVEAKFGPNLRDMEEYKYAEKGASV